MSTVKITDLTSIAVSSNSANSVLLGVDLPSDVTGKLSVKTLSEGIYRNNPLNVGSTPITLPNTSGQFTGTSNNYVQVNLLNKDEDGTADYVVTANAGGDTYYYIDMGYTNINYNPLTPNNSLGTSAYPLDGYLYVQGDGPGTMGGNLIIGTSSADREVVLISGGVNFDNIAAKITSTGLKIHYNKSLTFADDTVQTTAASPVSYSQASFALANTANAYAYSANVWLQANTGAALAAAKVYTDTANTFIKSNYLANTSGIFAGNLTITGNTVSQGYVDFNSSTFDPNTAFVAITGTANGVVVAPSNTNYMLQVTGKANTVTRVVIDSFGANTYPLLSGRMARGSSASPAPTQNNDVMMRIVGNGYLPTSGFKPSSPAKIDFVAAQNYTEANTGSRIEFWNTSINSNTIQKIASFNANSIEFTGVVNPTKGFIYSPVVYPGVQTAITIDMSEGPLIRAQTATGLTVTLSNLISGKVVELWVTNTSGNGQTFTHGCSAINSTTNSTTYSIPATSSITARYVCIDGTLANTLVSVIHA